MKNRFFCIAAVTLVLAGCERAGGPTDVYDPGNDAHEPVQTFMVPMRDGALLATDVYLPHGFTEQRNPGRVPAILVRTPYGKDRVNDAVARWIDMAARNGYAFVNQDMRGQHASAATSEAGPAAMDGYDTVEWVALQPWSNGRIGMMGFSHLGAAQYEAAVTDPPHLACAIPAQAPGNYYTDSFYPPRFRKADMETILRGPFTARTAALIETRKRRRDMPRVHEFNIPMLHSAGWYDFYKEGAIEMFQALQQHGGPGARNTQRLLIGPWGHGVLQEERPGEPLHLPGGLSYPEAAKPDWETDVWLPWFDHCLKGERTTLAESPAVRYYLMGAGDHAAGPGNRWIDADAFPPPSVATRYYIHSDGRLSRDAPTVVSDSMDYRYDPRDPVPWVGRTDVRVPVTGPYDQRPVEGRPDVLVFTTPVLTEPLTIVGRIQARVWAASDRTDTDFTVKLTHVHPDGRSMFVLDGHVKARYRNTYLSGELLEPGRFYEYEIDMGHIAIALPPGHRLRLAITSSSFDKWDINPNTGEPYGDHALTRSLLMERLGAAPSQTAPQFHAALVAENTIFMDRARPSHVTLPVLQSLP
jgi:uncharacterized protein